MAKEAQVKVALVLVPQGEVLVKSKVTIKLHYQCVYSRYAGSTCTSVIPNQGYMDSLPDQGVYSIMHVVGSI